MRPTSVTVTTVAASSWVPVNWRQPNFNLSVTVGGSGSCAWKVEFTTSDIFDPAVTPVAVTAPAPLEAGNSGTPEIANVTTPIRAIRLNVTAVTSGAAVMTVMQAD